MIDPAERLRAALAQRYAIERELGAGGMANVYLATDLTNRRHVAVKVLKADLSDAAGRSRFQREIEIVANLAHPNILPLHDSGRIDDLCWFVSPWVRGESLQARFDREGQLPLDEALRIAIEVADALAYAHEHDLVHRDIKPGNIMMEAGHAVVADFGIALQLSAAPADRLTTPGVTPGTPHYMSPEQLHGDRRIDGRSDIYSLGCVLYQMLAGDPPFTGSSVETIRARKLAGQVPDLRVVRPAVSAQLERTTLRCMALAPADRFRNATELVEALRNASDEAVRAAAGPST
jgi:serine/threonine-protein kinase